MNNNYEQNLRKTFNHMKSRCYNKDDKRYYDWGGRGITICDEWLNDVNSFFTWAVNNGYKPGLSIDRIDNDSGYSPENCRWVTLLENNQNRRSSRYFVINGEKKNLQQWCDFYNVSRSMVNKRLSMGWDIEKALTTPKKERDRESLIGAKFGRLTVISFCEVSKTRQSVYNCICDCGNHVTVNGNKLKSGHTRSCGCLKEEIVYRKKNV